MPVCLPSARRPESQELYAVSKARQEEADKAMDKKKRIAQRKQEGADKTRAAKEKADKAAADANKPTGFAKLTSMFK
jgi:hypothetical protein